MVVFKIHYFNNPTIEKFKSHTEEIKRKGKLLAIIETTLHDGTPKTAKIVWYLIASSYRMITNKYH